jgi:hypothetical protein
MTSSISWLTTVTYCTVILNVIFLRCSTPDHSNFLSKFLFELDLCKQACSVNRLVDNQSQGGNPVLSLCSNRTQLPFRTRVRGRKTVLYSTSGSPTLN